MPVVPSEEPLLKPEGDPAEIAAQLKALNEAIEKTRRDIADHYSWAQEQFGPDFDKAMQNPSAFLRREVRGAALHPQQPAQQAISPDALHGDRPNSDRVPSLDAGSGNSTTFEQQPGYFTNLMLDAGDDGAGTGSVSPQRSSLPDVNTQSSDGHSLDELFPDAGPADFPNSPDSSFQLSGDTWMKDVDWPKSPRPAARDELAGELTSAAVGHSGSDTGRDLDPQVETDRVTNPGNLDAPGNGFSPDNGARSPGEPSFGELLQEAGPVASFGSFNSSVRLSGDTWMKDMDWPKSPRRAARYELAGEVTSAPAGHTVSEDGRDPDPQVRSDHVASPAPGTLLEDRRPELKRPRNELENQRGRSRDFHIGR